MPQNNYKDFCDAIRKHCEVQAPGMYKEKKHFKHYSQESKNEPLVDQVRLKAHFHVQGL